MDSLVPVPGTAFVGREPELATLTARLDTAIAGQGSVVLMAGEPGIGKTRLAEELTSTAQERGARVIWGRCYEGEGAPAFWPWIEILRGAIRGETTSVLQADMGVGTADIVTLMPELRAFLGSVPDTASSGARPDLLQPAADPAEARFRFFDAVTRYLGARVARQPHVLILDDLHWADASSLLLLQFLARGVRAMGLLVVGGYRDVEVDRKGPMATALTALNRERGYQHLSLRGLSATATAALLEEAGQEQAPTASFIQALHRLTGGNPLFIHETVRHLAETGRLGGPGELDARAATETAPLEVPESVRGVVRQRLARLPESAAHVLTSAAVIGREFEMATLSTISDLAGLPVLETLDAAEAARLVRSEASAGGALRYRFSHDVIRETLYADLDRSARARLHLQVGEALEERWRADLAPRVSELAYHFVQAAPGNGTVKAVAYARQAGDRSLGQFAYDEAARWYELALDVLSRWTSVDEATQCDLLLAHGEALLMAGSPRRVVDMVAPAALVLAEALGEAGQQRAARACRLALVGLIRYAGPGSLVGSVLFRTWTARADRYAPPNSVDRVHADIALADAQSVHGGLAETAKLYRRALALARELEEPDLLYFAAFQVLNWAGGPSSQAERLRLAREFSTRPRDGMGARNLGRALWRSGSILLDWGERERAEALWQDVAELAAHTHERDLLLFTQIGDAILATLDGKLDEALAALARLVEWSAELGSPGQGLKYAARLQERLLLWLGPGATLPAALRADLHAATKGDVWAPGNAVSVALRLAQDGQPAEGQRILGEAVRELQDGGEDAVFPWHLVALLELAVAVEDRAAVGILAPLLEPLAPCATADWGLTTVARHLGDAAALLGDARTARTYYEQALLAARGIRFRPEVALTSLQLAALARDVSDEREHVQRLHEFAVAELQGTNMQPALDRARRLKSRPGVPKTAPAHPSETAEAPDQLTAREVEVLSLVAAGRSNREIADALVVSVRTVEHHIERIYRKIDARGRVDATTYALRHGLAVPDEPTR